MKNLELIVIKILEICYYNAQQNAFNSGNAEVITTTGAATTFGIGARYDFRENENDTFRIILRKNRF